MTIYADYDYYVNNYGGNAIAEMDFTRLSRQVSVYLNTLTLDKITGDWKTDERVKDACCAVADIYAWRERGGEVSSETNDGASVTYVTSGKTIEQQTANTAALYLANTGLLYRGID